MLFPLKVPDEIPSAIQKDFTNQDGDPPRLFQKIVNNKECEQ